MSEHLPLREGCSRLVLRIAGTSACVGLGREIAGLEDSLEQVIRRAAPRPTLGIRSDNTPGREEA